MRSILSLTIAILAGSTYAATDHVTSIGTYVMSGGSYSGSISVWPTRSYDRVVTLKSNNPAVTLPAQVTIPASASTVSFNIQATAPVSGVVTGDIYGQLSGNTSRGGFLVVGASKPAITLKASPIEGGVLLDWSCIDPEFLVKSRSSVGYIVRRKDSAGTVSILNRKTSASSFELGASGSFLDSNARTGQAYSYQVALTNPSNSKDILASSWVNGSTSNSSGVSWLLPPSLTNSTVSFSLTAGANQPSGSIYVNGFSAGIVSKLADGYSSNLTTLSGTLNVFDLGYRPGVTGNGSASISLTSEEATKTVAATAKGLTLSPPNGSIRSSLEDFVSSDADDSSLIQVQGKLSDAPASRFAASVTIYDISGNVVRQLSTSTLPQQGICELATVWDGRDETGAKVVEGEYTASVTFQTPSLPTYPLTQKIFVGPSNAEGVFLIGQTEYDTPQIVADYASHIRQQMELRKYFYTQYKYIVITTLSPGPVDGNLSEKMKRKIREWMGSSLKDFYIYGHGSPLMCDVGGVQFLSYATTNSRGEVPGAPDPSKPIRQISVPLCLGTQIMNSVYMDSCNSAASTDWLYAWRIAGNPEASCFVGMSGLNGAITAESPPPYGKHKSIWYDFNTRYWTLLSQGYYISQAIGIAKSKCSGTVPGFDPRTQGLIQIYGNAQIPGG